MSIFNNKNNNSHYNHTTWSSSLGFILAATGAAVGLGNIWKFPYMVGDNGGGAFVLIYILAILLVGLPLMIAEILLGRVGRRNPIDTMYKLAKENNCTTNWQITGWFGAIALLLTLSFYSVIAGWSVAYFFKYLFYIISNTDLSIFINNKNLIINQWNDFLSSPFNIIFWQIIFLLLTVVVVMCGVTSGIEKASNLLMPLLFVMLFILAIYAANYGDFYKGLEFLLKPDFSKINSKVVIDALGQAFFSLAIGAGCMLTYGAYLPKHTSIVKSVFIISSLNILVAFLSGLAIFPIVFANNLEPNVGADLMFKVLPIAFSSIPFGSVVGCLFFLLLTFAAWTSSISMLEPLVMISIEKLHIKRFYSCIIIGLISCFISIFAALSFNTMSDCLIFNKWNFFGAITDLTTNLLLPIGGILFAVFTGWKLKSSTSKEYLVMQSDKYSYKPWYFLIKYVVPIAILVILFNSIF